jgi:hypothetical protein
VRNGRKSEFAHFLKGVKECPDPYAYHTFCESAHSESLAKGGRGKLHYEYLQKLFQLRKSEALQASAACFEARVLGDSLLTLTRQSKRGQTSETMMLIASLSEGKQEIDIIKSFPDLKGLQWDFIINTSNGIEHKSKEILSGNKVIIDGIGALIVSGKHIY